MSKGAYVILKKSLSLADPDRLGRAVNRLVTAADVGGREKFRAIPEGYSIQEVREMFRWCALVCTIPI